MNVTQRLLALSTLVVATALPLHGDGADAYGKPLRGLTPVPLSSVAASPEKYRERSIRVTGTAALRQGRVLTLSDGDATVLLRPQGFTLPESVAGAQVTAEGRLAKDGALAILAVGAEVRR